MAEEQLEMKYFVLKPKSKEPNDMFARASRLAMRMYADTIRFNHPTMALSIDAWAQAETDAELKMIEETKKDDGE